MSLDKFQHIDLTVIGSALAKVATAAAVGGMAYGVVTTTLDGKADAERVAIVETKVATIQQDVPETLRRIEHRLERMEDKLDGKEDKP